QGVSLLVLSHHHVGVPVGALCCLTTVVHLIPVTQRRHGLYAGLESSQTLILALAVIIDQAQQCLLSAIAAPAHTCAKITAGIISTHCAQSRIQGSWR